MLLCCRVFEIVKVESSTMLTELSFRHGFQLVRVVRLADIHVAWLVYVRTYCVLIATSSQNKRSRLLYLRNVPRIIYCANWISQFRSLASYENTTLCFLEKEYVWLLHSSSETFCSPRENNFVIIISPDQFPCNIKVRKNRQQKNVQLVFQNC